MHPINAEKTGHVVSGSPVRRPVRKKEGRSGNKRKKGRNEKRTNKKEKERIWEEEKKSSKKDKGKK